MSVRPGRRVLAAILAGCAFSSSPLLASPSSAAVAAVELQQAVQASTATTAATTATTAVAARTGARTGARTASRGAGHRAYRITVRGWTRTIRRGNQSTIDRCRTATLWQGPLPGGRGTTWLAGHDHCGFYRWDRLLHVGDRFSVTTPRGTVLRYRVTGRGYVGRHSGSAAGLIRGDITLQTCRGAGTAFTYARLIRR